MQRNPNWYAKQMKASRDAEFTAVAAKMIIYEGFIESEPEVGKTVARNPNRRRDGSPVPEVHAEVPRSGSSKFSKGYAAKPLHIGQ